MEECLAPQLSRDGSRKAFTATNEKSIVDVKMSHHDPTVERLENLPHIAPRATIDALAVDLRLSLGPLSCCRLGQGLRRPNDLWHLDFVQRCGGRNPGRAQAVAAPLASTPVPPEVSCPTRWWPRARRGREPPPLRRRECRRGRVVVPAEQSASLQVARDAPRGVLENASDLFGLEPERVLCSGDEHRFGRSTSARHRRRRGRPRERHDTHARRPTRSLLRRRTPVRPTCAGVAGRARPGGP